tara:strand:- start:33 stop:815 length:783 start_codon:yes stop_codon:yes gene_type:complete
MERTNDPSRLETGVMSFDELCLKFNTDKSTASHGYAPVYDDLFRERRYKDLLVLEIGVFRGASLNVLSSYFTNSRVVGIDIRPESEIKQYEDEEEDRYVRIGSQTDTEFLQKVIDEFGDPDIIIDDGSHTCRDVTQTFEFLWPHLKPGGIYVVEDIHMSYDPTGYYRKPEEYMSMDYFAVGTHALNRDIYRSRWAEMPGVIPPGTVNRRFPLEAPGLPTYDDFKDLRDIRFFRKMVILNKWDPDSQHLRRHQDNDNESSE